jgi:spoIIIJ-associated protein
VEAPQTIEATGTTIVVAIARGLEALNVAQDVVDILILSAEPGRTARVRLTRKPRETAAAESSPAAQPVAAEESAETQRILQAVLDRMKYKVQIVERNPADLNGYDEQDEPTLVLDIHGTDLSTLIGRRGETLDGLQYLIRLLAAKELGHTCTSCLMSKATRHIAQMLSVGAAHDRSCGDNPQARRAGTHASQRAAYRPPALRDHTQVRTESVGVGDNRKVTIIPQSYKR